MLIFSYASKVNPSLLLFLNDVSEGDGINFAIILFQFYHCKLGYLMLLFPVTKNGITQELPVRFFGSKSEQEWTFIYQIQISPSKQIKK